MARNYEEFFCRPQVAAGDRWNLAPALCGSAHTHPGSIGGIPQRNQMDGRPQDAAKK
jgi:hypothetical protein